VPPKGPRDLLAAIALLPAACLDLHFVWVGDGPDENALQAEVGAAGLNERVHLMGYRRNVAPFLYAADLFVFPTHCEGLSRAVIEAMSAGLPIVLSDASSNPELIEDGRHGLIFPARDPALLASRLEYALGHPTEMRQMARAARAKARCELTASAMCDGILRIMDEVAQYTGSG
jgi:glycosyltransferase involved in cell wall biosynthesis